jgi:hypothetical protein
MMHGSVVYRLCKPFAVFMLWVLLYNFAGHYLVLLGVQYRSDFWLIEQIQHDVMPEEDFFVVKIPISLYLPSPDTDFEPASGRFEVHGKHYNMVKKRVLNDTLHVYCVHNQYKANVAEMLSQYVKSYVIDDFAADGSDAQGTQKLPKPPVKDLPDIVSSPRCVHKLLPSMELYFGYVSAIWSKPFPEQTFPPPETV